MVTDAGVLCITTTIGNAARSPAHQVRQRCVDKNTDALRRLGKVVPEIGTLFSRREISSVPRHWILNRTVSIYRAPSQSPRR